jgi:uncharacterized protein (TIGR03435 family)
VNAGRMRIVRIYVHAPSYFIALIALSARAQSFEVASVKIGRPPARSSFGPLPGDERYRAVNAPLSWLISAAYGVPIRQISGLPQALSGDGYDIEAKAEHPVNRDQMMQMLQHLLEDRFNLAVRRETKEIKAYVLVVAKGGAKMDESHGGDLVVQKINASKTFYQNMPMPVFANLLAFSIDDTVVDQTGLSATYDFTLNYMPERLGPGVLEGREPGPDPNAPSLSTALQQQLGLKLESRRGPVEMLVIERIEKLSQN